MVRALPSASDAAKTGRRCDLPLGAGWNVIKHAAILTAFRAQFTQRPDARAPQDTGEASLIEPHATTRPGRQGTAAA